MGRTARYRVLVGLLVSPALLRGDILPQGLESAGLARIVPDTVASQNEGRTALNNWDPYASVLGNSVFLIQSNTFARNLDGGIDPQHQRHALTFQKVTGGPFTHGDVFFGDDWAPYRQTINTSRQDGNPGRVAGDARPGAVYFMAGGETSVHFWGDTVGEAFYSNPNRWTLGMIRAPLDRYATVQTYWLDTETLEQAPPMSMAQDAIHGRRTSGDPAETEVDKFGGDIVALSNGNFVVLTDDRSLLLAAVRTPTAVVMSPEGQIVKESWAINPSVPTSIWSNLAAFQGGFCIRFGGTLYFHDNAGNLAGTAVQQDPALVDALGTPVTLRTDRGDEHRIAGHINSNYVFLGSNWHNSSIDKDIVGLAVWNATTRSFVAYTNVNEMTPSNGGSDADNFFPEHAGGGDSDRVHVAVDALNRVVVSYEVTLPGYALTQTVCRVLRFDSNTNTFSYLTPSFFPFINYATSNPTLGIRSWRPSVAMTTRQICVAAQGEINLDNQPQSGFTSSSRVVFYTVFSHPDPQDDSTPPVTPPSGCPTITAITPDNTSTKLGGAQHLEITGTGFVPGSTSVSMRLRGHPHIIVPAAAVTVAPGGASLTLDLTPATADPAVYNVFVSVAGSGCPPAESAQGFTISECSIPAADAHGDGDVDQKDFAVLQRCLTLDNDTVQDGCACFDRDADDDIDADDVSAFVDCATGPAIPWRSGLAPNCQP